MCGDPVMLYTAFIVIAAVAKGVAHFTRTADNASCKLAPSFDYEKGRSLIRANVINCGTWYKVKKNVYLRVCVS